jgi:hypothetical protein
MTAVPWLADFAMHAGLSYDPDPDERWLRVWEPYVTLRTPVRYEHALGATGTTTALTVARFVLPPRPGYAVGDEGWIAVGQDERLHGTAAATSDMNPIYRDEGTTLPRQPTGDGAFDAVFATFGPDVPRVINAEVRRIAVAWRTPVHFELRQGGYILAPVALRPDAASLAWLLDAARVLANKAALN